MQTKSLIAMMAASALQVAGGPAVARGDVLAPLKGKSRPVVVLSDSRDDPRVAKQISALDHTRPALIERNIEVLREAQPESALRKSLEHFPLVKNRTRIPESRFV